MYVLRPGGVSDWRNLDDMLRARHEAEAAAYDLDRKLREEAGAPADEAEAWPEDAARALEAARKAAEGGNRAEARAALERALAAVVPPPVDPGAYVEDPAAASLELRFRTLSRAEHRDGVLAVAKAATAETLEELDRLMCDYVGRAVVAIRGFEDDAGPYGFEARGDEGLPLDALEALRLSGYLRRVYVAARDFQSLTGDEKKAFGRRRQTTAYTSAIADAAPANVATNGGATATPSPATGSGQSTSTTHALNVSYSAPRGSSTPSGSLEQATAGNLAQAG